MSPVVERLPTNAERHDPDNDDPTSIEHLTRGGTEYLGNGDATEVENSNAEHIAYNQRTTAIQHDTTTGSTQPSISHAVLAHWYLHILKDKV